MNLKLIFIRDYKLKFKRAIYLTPTNSQLWISTHSIGMLKQAEELEKEIPGSVVFLDF
jgi:uncharacterized protein with von Willebrand factor type A (vWA) domain